MVYDIRSSEQVSIQKVHLNGQLAKEIKRGFITFDEMCGAITTKFDIVTTLVNQNTILDVYTEISWSVEC